jgi:hypothetical protein
MAAWLAAIPGLISAGAGLWQTIKSGKEKKKALAEMDKQSPPDYQTSPYAQEAMLEARLSKGAVSPAMLMAQQSAQQQAANTAAAAQRNATSGAEALAAGNIAQAQYQAMLPQLAAAQQARQDQQQRNLQEMLAGMTEEERAKFMGRRQRYADLMSLALGRLGAANAGIASGLGNIASGAQSLSSTSGQWAGKGSQSVNVNGQTLSV